MGTTNSHAYNTAARGHQCTLAGQTCCYTKLSNVWHTDSQLNRHDAIRQIKSVRSLQQSVPNKCQEAHGTANSCTMCVSASPDSHPCALQVEQALRMPGDGVWEVGPGQVSEPPNSASFTHCIDCDHEVTYNMLHVPRRTPSAT